MAPGGRIRKGKQSAIKFKYNAVRDWEEGIKINSKTNPGDCEGKKKRNGMPIQREINIFMGTSAQLYVLPQSSTSGFIFGTITANIPK